MALCVIKYLKYLRLSSKTTIEINLAQKPIFGFYYLLSHLPLNVNLRQKPVIYMPFQQILSQSYQ